jgi:N-methylhydantoinase B
MSDSQLGERSPHEAAADRVTLEIIRNAFIAIVRQAGRIVVRSSFSPIIRDAFDFCVTIVAPPRPEDELDLDIVAMNESLAHFSGVMPFAVRNMLWEYGIEHLEPGDLIAFNNPYKSGNHIYDNGFFRPVFVAGEFVAGIAIKAHLMDMGGAMAGGYAVGKRSLWEEGVAISGVPVYKDDRPYIPGFSLYADNSRLPQNMLADIQAVNSAASFAERRVQALFQKYSSPTVFDAMTYTLRYGESSMRAALAVVPDGIYEGEDGLDRDADVETPFSIKCRINKRGDTLEADLSGTTRQSGSAINCPAFDAANGVYTAIKFLCDPHTANNSGAFRPIDVVLPEGSFVAALPPAATTMYFDAVARRRPRPPQRRHVRGTAVRARRLRSLARQRRRELRLDEPAEHHGHVDRGDRGGLPDGDRPQGVRRRPRRTGPMAWWRRRRLRPDRPHRRRGAPALSPPPPLALGLRRRLRRAGRRRLALAAGRRKRGRVAQRRELRPDRGQPGGDSVGRPL